MCERLGATRIQITCIDRLAQRGGGQNRTNAHIFALLPRTCEQNFRQFGALLRGRPRGFGYRKPAPVKQACDANFAPRNQSWRLGLSTTRSPLLGRISGRERARLSGFGKIIGARARGRPTGRLRSNPSRATSQRRYRMSLNQLDRGAR